MKNIVAYLIVLIGLSITSFGALAHSGGLDRNGCHHDNSNGNYHCH